MLSGNPVRLLAPNLTYFAGTLAQNAGINARIPLPMAIAAGGGCRCTIEKLQIISADNLAWEFWFWGTALAQNVGNPDLETFLGYWSFAAADGKQIGGTGLYYYYIDGLGIDYADLDARGLAQPPNPSAYAGYLNATLVNRSAGAKTAGARFQAAFSLAPTVGI